MITFIILLSILLALIIVGLFIALVGGTGLLLVFGDLIVCVLIIWLIIHLIRRKK